ncbi:MAG: hypothetical protein AAFR76_10240 [Planctomycetota bacterium]
MLFGLVGCVFWIPLLAVAVLSCVVLYPSLTTAAVVGPQCGGCGYAVADIPGTTCPECGRSLLTVGVATRSVVLSWIVMWIWLMSSAGGVMGGGGGVAMTGTITPTGSATHGPIAVDVDSTGWGQAGTLRLEVTSDDGVLHEVLFDGMAEPLSMTVWSDGVAVWNDPSGLISDGLDAWCDAAGIDGTTDPAGETRTDLDSYVPMVVMTPMSADETQFVLTSSTMAVANATGTVGQLSSGFVPSGWELAVSVALMAVTVVGYIVGVVLIARRRSKLMRLV